VEFENECGVVEMGNAGKRMKYVIRFDFNGGCTIEIGKCLIFGKTGLVPYCENPGSGVRYETDDVAVARKLIMLVLSISSGGCIVINPMPEGHDVFCLPLRGEKVI